MHWIKEDDNKEDLGLFMFGSFFIGEGARFASGQWPLRKLLVLEVRIVRNMKFWANVYQCVMSCFITTTKHTIIYTFISKSDHLARNEHDTTFTLFCLDGRFQG